MVFHFFAFFLSFVLGKTANLFKRILDKMGETLPVFSREIFIHDKKGCIFRGNFSNKIYLFSQILSKKERV